MPYNSMGSIPVFEAAKKNIPIYAVKENKTVLDVTAEKLNIECISVDTYDEAFDLIHKS